MVKVNMTPFKYQELIDAKVENNNRDEDDRAREDRGGPDFFNGFFLALTIVGVIVSWSMFG